ncbi:MAG: 50S ribosomal protein L6 [Bacteroidota bacterium]
MSRIGKQPILIPKEVEVIISTNEVSVKGPLGTLIKNIPSVLQVEKEDNLLTIMRGGDTKKEKSLHGLYRALMQNMITGVFKGYQKTLELVGVGYKVSLDKNVLEINVGKSHLIYFVIPNEVKVALGAGGRGKHPSILLKGNDIQLLGQLAAKIRSIRKPEPYKQKGIRVKGEVIRKKAGKTAAK